jgi:hypothetical protein
MPRLAQTLIVAGAICDEVSGSLFDSGCPSVRENSLQHIGRGATELTCHPSKETVIDAYLRALESLLRVDEILRAACEALHRDKVLATDHSKRVSTEWDIHRPREDLRVKPT